MLFLERNTILPESLIQNTNARLEIQMTDVIAQTEHTDKRIRFAPHSKNKSAKNVRTILTKLLYMTLGVILLTVGVQLFQIPNGFSIGGVGGLGAILGKALPFLSPGDWIIIINILSLIFGFLFLGKEVGIYTLYCCLVYSFFTWLFELFFPLKNPLTDQPGLELIYALLLTSLGSVIIFEQNASSGGMEVAALILKKYTKMNVGHALLCADFIIAASAFPVFGIKTGLFSLLGLFVKAFLVDGIIDNINSCKYFIIITDKPDEITQYVTNALHRGVTTNEAEGAFSQKRKIMLHTVCRRIEALRLRSKIYEIDPNAFIIITTTSEIIGNGFQGNI